MFCLLLRVVLGCDEGGCADDEDHGECHLVAFGLEVLVGLVVPNVLLDGLLVWFGTTTTVVW